MLPISPFVRFAIRVPLEPGERHGPRYCYVPSIYLIEFGSATIVYEDGHEVSLRTGSLLYINAGIKHTWIVDKSEPCTFRCVFFDWFYSPKPALKLSGDYLGDRLDEGMLDETLDLGLIECLTIPSLSTWRRWFEAVDTDYHVLLGDDQLRSLSINGNFNLLLHQLLLLVERQNDRRDPRIAKLMSAMEQSAAGEYQDISGWAEKLNLSRSHFHALFRSQTGLTPKKYWNQCRIQKAQHELLLSNDSVTDIAERYGYSSVHVFTKSFHRSTGMTPTAYRRQGRLH
ncbi:AraC-like DNA-binding protein [Paenibacillus taihuensis]|uniref:AraC-like DNA-binding protein n=1 Tax=Paenibacillus taihuensis TaxID=1156355 RepID=A0A3D9SDI7_9BACL|nr:AraC family transcriptional regulator [Paenibacillus taihuensis]REE87460.1 AraC-like DNA-binding protein [Paenibacillus taihuensis]